MFSDVNTLLLTCILHTSTEFYSSVTLNTILYSFPNTSFKDAFNPSLPFFSFVNHLSSSFPQSTQKAYF